MAGKRGDMWRDESRADRNGLAWFREAFRSFGEGASRPIDASEYAAQVAARAEELAAGGWEDEEGEPLPCELRAGRLDLGTRPADPRRLALYERIRSLPAGSTERRQLARLERELRASG